jgi:hypothetical protein
MVCATSVRTNLESRARIGGGFRIFVAYGKDLTGRNLVISG